MWEQNYKNVEEMKASDRKRGLGTFLQAHDNFAEPVSNLMEGKQFLGTTCGGIATLVINVFLLAVGVWYFITMCKHEHYDLKQSQIHY